MFLVAFVVVATLQVFPVQGFMHHDPHCFVRPCFATIRHAASKDDDDTMFDPLLSPHSYPNGVDAGAVPPGQGKDEIHIDTERRDGEKRSFGFLTHRTEATLGDEEPIGEVGDAVMFDPLLSPHAYPKGIDSGPVSQEATVDKQSSSPKKPFGISLDSAPTPPSSRSIDPATFDPTLSPHAYGNQPSEEKVGILLIDHGSKSPAANERLAYIADRYREQHGGIVQIAHMELAEPSIQDGIRALLQEDVDEILCQPYFLSPGRHVREDIPHLVEDAIQALDVQIPCRITPHVGSVTDGMVQAIHSLVTQTAASD